MRKTRVVVATSNPGKLRELRALLPNDFELVTAEEAGVVLPPESGRTFEENALLKARAAAQQTGLLALADDSGLEVDALGGEPGVHSACYAGPHASSEEHIGLLLDRLTGVPSERRSARFRAVVAVVSPDGRELTSHGVLEGRITTEPHGRGGFGYDPVFQPLGQTRTLAEMTLEEKNLVSHRAQALRQAVAALHGWLESRPGNGGCSRPHAEDTER
jgi:XTP/dITP diphosphohydrolase